ncbi:hypothetical protein R3P38DRAFT_3407319 [Favolaschia claudopus]|uniref:Uncharacterized protein n=1 Tax=Favolaschia claudopus TaxID=2862362 RepID=A0AAV9ZZE8_9AGAR
MLWSRPRLCAPLNRLLLQAQRYHVSRTKSCQNPLLPVLPELFDPNFLDQLIPRSSNVKEHVLDTPSPSNPMMDALSQFSHRTLTENSAPAYDSTLSPTLDAFQKLTHFSWGDSVGELLDRAWAEDPQLTLKIIWNLRSIHDGKSEKEGFYRAFGWLYDNHPRTAITNLHLLVEPVCGTGKAEQELTLSHGYWKDLLNILALETVGELSNISKRSRLLHCFPERKGKDRLGSENLDKHGIKVDLKPVVKAKRAAIGEANHALLEKKLQDPKFRALYIAVARLFADRLLTDWRFLLDSETTETTDARKALLRNISLASKWAPSLLGMHDRHTNIATAISRLVYHAKDAFPTFRFPAALENHPALESAEATDILRSFYRRWLLSPLRAASSVTETFMSANRWKEISYSRVSSVCMKNNKDRFFEHDPDGFQKYLISVEKGHRSISGATLLPHELLGELYGASTSVTNSASAKYPELHKHRAELAGIKIRVLEAQWKTLLENLRASGTLNNSIAVCDVSGSMGSIDFYNSKCVDPIFPAVSLSILFAQLAKAPFDRGFITFSANPQFIQLDPRLSLVQMAERVVSSEWGMNTDIRAVFTKLLLPLAIQNKVKQEDMIKRVFVFSDMQFDGTERAAGGWDTNYDVIERKFRVAGYEVPEIVYWNLGAFETVEVLKDRKGVALMSGFSPSMLKVFMGEEEVEAEAGKGEEAAVDGEVKVNVEKVKEEFNPLNVMKKALLRPSFDGLVVVD